MRNTGASGFDVRMVWAIRATKCSETFNSEMPLRKRGPGPLMATGDCSTWNIAPLLMGVHWERQHSGGLGTVSICGGRMGLAVTWKPVWWPELGDWWRARCTVGDGSRRRNGRTMVAIACGGGRKAELDLNGIGAAS